MKSWKIQSFIFSAILAFGQGQLLLAGNTSGGGGITIAAKFATTGRQAIGLLGMGDPSLDINAITEGISGTKVVPVDSICYKEPTLGKQYCEDAHYDSVNNIILLNFKNWDIMQCTDKMVLSAHEFFRAAGLEGEDYKYSGRFIYRNIVQCPSESSEAQAKCADLDMVINRKIGLICEKLKPMDSSRQ